MCSDGLTNELDDSAIAEQLANTEDPGVIAKALVAAANEHGGRDNSTVLVVDVQAEPLTEDNELREVAEDYSVDLGHKEDKGLDASRSRCRQGLRNEASCIHYQTAKLAIRPSSYFSWSCCSHFGSDRYNCSDDHHHWLVRTVRLSRRCCSESCGDSKGRAGGLLWFEPTLEQWTEIQISELSDTDQSRLANSGHMSTLNEAQSFVATLQTRQFGGEVGS